MTTSSDVTTVRLPHSGLRVPDLSLTITGYIERETPDGVAFTAKLRLNDTIVGVVRNAGDGGATAFTADDWRKFGPAELEAYAKMCADETGQPILLVETLLDQLVSEAVWQRAALRTFRHGQTPIRLMDAAAPDLVAMPCAQLTGRRPTQDEHWRELSKQLSEGTLRPGDGQWWQAWTGVFWRDVTRRPKHVPADLYS